MKKKLLIDILREDPLYLYRFMKYEKAYSTNSNFLEIKELVSEIIENIKELSTDLGLDFKPTKVLALITYLIHNGYLSENKKYEYREKVNNNIIAFTNLDRAIEVISGSGCCRHSASFLGIVLDEFNIENRIINVSINNSEFAEIYALLSDFHKEVVKSNHVINYVKDGDKEYFIDATVKNITFYYHKNHILYNFFDEDYKAALCRYSRYAPGVFPVENIKTPSTFEQAEILYEFENAILMFGKNESYFEEFYLKNIENYRKINMLSNKIAEEEKCLRLVK